jgi:hypothetical protein
MQDERTTAIAELSELMNLFVHVLTDNVPNLSAQSIRDATDIWVASRQDEHFNRSMMLGLLMEPNASYRIALLKKFADIDPQFINKWVLLDLDQRVTDLPLTEHDATEDNALWLLTVIYVTGVLRLQREFNFGHFTETAEGVRNLIKSNPDEETAIKHIINDHRVYKAEDIMHFLSGAPAMREGHL